MRFLLFALALFVCLASSFVHGSRLSCGVCESLVDEVESGIASSKHTHSVQTRFRVDEKKHVPYARTEHHLLEMMEAEEFVKRFKKYAIVKPWTKTASHMKRAYALAEQGEQIESLPKENNKPAAATTTAAADNNESGEATSTNEGATTATTEDAAATPVDTVSTDDTAAAGAVSDADVPPSTYAPFLPVGSLPLALRHNHIHLVPRSTLQSTGLRGESSPAITTEITTRVSAFLDEYLDEAMLMFSRDVPDIKQKLCYEVTEACVPQKRKPKNQQADKKTNRANTNKDDL